MRFDFTADGTSAPALFAAAVEAQIAAADQPFQEQTLAACRAVLAAIAPQEKRDLDVSNVQAALTALQDKSLVWRERRGVYALEDATLAVLLEREGLLAVVPSLEAGSG